MGLRLRMGAVALAATAAFGLAGSPAFAAYPPAGPSASLCKPSAGPEVSNCVNGENYKPGTSASATLDGASLGSATASGAANSKAADGSFSIPFTNPPCNGTYDVAVSGTALDGSPNTQHLVLTVAGATCTKGESVTSTTSGSGSGSLARTGADHTMELTLLGAGLIAVGAGAATAARRRSSARR